MLPLSVVSLLMLLTDFLTMGLGLARISTVLLLLLASLASEIQSDFKIYPISVTFMVNRFLVTLLEAI